MSNSIFINPYCIETIEGFTPAISHLIKMMNYARITTLESVEGLSTEQLDFQFSEKSNSIGALLAHIAAVEKWYQVYTFEKREMKEEEFNTIRPAMELGQLGREKIKGNTSEFYIEELRKARRVTIEEFSKRDDEWLLKPIDDHTTIFREKENYYFDWFHVLEDEINHRGQIRLIRKMQGIK